MFIDIITENVLMKEVTLQNVLLSGILNDISYLSDERLVVLVEHQSTVNSNLPLRMLLYADRIYKNLIDIYAIYREKLLKIPHPVFAVFITESKIILTMYD
jgi:hypothetical protein